MKSTAKPVPKSTPHAPTIPEKDPVNDLKKFAALPGDTRELATLQDDVDRSDGPAAVALQKKVNATGERVERRKDASG